MAAETGQQPIADPLAAGRAALTRGEWDAARTAFETALGAAEGAAGEPPPAGASALGGDADRGAALEGLGWAGWWLADEELTIGAREEAFRAYRDAGERGAAARVAAWLAADYREFRAEGSVGRGWLARAHSALEGETDSADHGWVALIDGDFALNLDADVGRAERLSLEAAERGRGLGVADLEAVGLAQAGIATVLQGRVEEGMRRLDEASVIARSEDLQLPVSAGWALCCLISACDGVGDFARAGEWCATMRDFSERWGGRQMLGVCRSAYGRVLAAGGDWPAADAELTAALADIEATRPGMAAGGLVRLGEHRARQGRIDEARELFERAGPAGLVGLGRLALDRGDASAAADVAQRVLRALPEEVALERLPALELLARARAAVPTGTGVDGSGAEASGGDGSGAEASGAEASGSDGSGAEAAVDDGAAALAELERIAELLDTPYLRARARLVTGELAAARGAADAARQAFEDAIDCFAVASAPYEAAVARMGLAEALAERGEGRRAEDEAEAARATFASLGALRDLQRAEAFLAAPASAAKASSDVRVRTSAAARRAAGEDTAAATPAARDAELSPRELEVLALVAQGLSDTEIAERLVVSPHTVHRHVANVRAKLRLPSRAAAVAYAAREGLL